jgi:hypothetical protein
MEKGGASVQAVEEKKKNFVRNLHFLHVILMLAFPSSPRREEN